MFVTFYVGKIIIKLKMNFIFQSSYLIFIVPGILILNTSTGVEKCEAIDVKVLEAVSADIFQINKEVVQPLILAGKKSK